MDIANSWAVRFSQFVWKCYMEIIPLELIIVLVNPGFRNSGTTLTAIWEPWSKYCGPFYHNSWFCTSIFKMVQKYCREITWWWRWCILSKWSERAKKVITLLFVPVPCVPSVFMQTGDQTLRKCWWIFIWIGIIRVFIDRNSQCAILYSRDIVCIPGCFIGT